MEPLLLHLRSSNLWIETSRHCADVDMARMRLPVDGDRALAAGLGSFAGTGPSVCRNVTAEMKILFRSQRLFWHSGSSVPGVVDQR